MKKREGGKKGGRKGEKGRKGRKVRKVLDLLKVPISSSQHKHFKCKILNVILITDTQ